MKKQDKLVDKEKYSSHKVSEVICLKCLERWICVRPSWLLLKEIECKNKHTGSIIETGEVMK